jgi:hypothetical protein
VCLFLLATPEYLLQLLDVGIPAKIIALSRVGYVHQLWFGWLHGSSRTFAALSPQAKSLAQVTALKALQALAQYPAGRSEFDRPFLDPCFVLRAHHTPYVGLCRCVGGQCGDGPSDCHCARVWQTRRKAFGCENSAGTDG